MLASRSHTFAFAFTARLSRRSSSTRTRTRTIRRILATPCLEQRSFPSFERTLTPSVGSITGSAFGTYAADQAPSFEQSSSSSSSSSSRWSLVTAAATACGLAALSSRTEPTPIASCESATPSSVAEEDFQSVQDSHDVSKMPVYTAAQVAEHDGTKEKVSPATSTSTPAPTSTKKPMWMTYGGIVYDVTDFVANHPGGSEKISLAAGAALEPFWYQYRQHFASDLPMKLLEHMAIGRLAEADQALVDAEMERLDEDDANDPYAKEPTLRHRALKVHSDTPMNAEVPARLLTKQYLTPASLFYIRHHHPVPYVNPLSSSSSSSSNGARTTENDQTDKHPPTNDDELTVENYRLIVDLTALGKGTIELSLDQLRALPTTHVTATLQCSGNRRSGYNDHARTSGTPWGQGAISTARFGGVLLRTVLEAAGLNVDSVQEIIDLQERHHMEHVRFHALDGMSASIGIEKALNPYGDVLVCYEMNGEPLPPDHGFPVRIITPGYAAVRNVKWVERIELAKTEAEGPWQRGLNYKTLPPSVTDAGTVELDEMPSMTEVSLFSGITHMEIVTDTTADTNKYNTDETNNSENTMRPTQPGDVVQVTTSGWAWSGGGRNIVRVDVTGDEGKTWATAKLKEGSNQRFGRAWAWTFWECELPAVVQADGTVRLASKSVDLAFNVQPESSDHIWNVRGLGNNSWYRCQKRVI